MHPTSPKIRWLLRAGFALALVGTLYFGIRVAMGAFYWSDPAHRDQVIEGWMPLGYVGRSWNVPREVMMEIAGITPDGRPRRSLEMIARDENIPLPVLIERIQSGIAQWRERPHD
ncbi:MAG: hypothetical protein LCH92_19750 [Proteobacteria bacterium]|nr:hypothetical protein [Pseudomonadota bacterium]